MSKIGLFSVLSLVWIVLLFCVGTFVALLQGENEFKLWEYGLMLSVGSYIVPFGGIWCAFIAAHFHEPHHPTHNRAS